MADFVYESGDDVIPRRTRSAPAEETGKDIHERMLTRATAADAEEDGGSEDAYQARQSTLHEDSISSARLFRRSNLGPIYCLALFNPEGSGEGGRPFVAVAGRDGLIRLFYLDDKEPFGTLEGHTNAVMCLSVFRPTGEGGEESSAVVISGGRDKTVRVWVVSKLSGFKTLTGHTDTVWCVQCMQPTELEPVVVSGDLQGNILIWSLLRGELLRTIAAIPLDAKDRGVMCLQIYNPPTTGREEYSSPLVVSGGEDQLINVWSIETGELLKVFLGHSDVVMCLALCENFVGEVEADADVEAERDTLVVSGSKDGTVRIWSMATTEMLRILRSHTSTVFAVCAQPLQYFDAAPAVAQTNKETLWGALLSSVQSRPVSKETVGVSGGSRDSSRSGETQAGGRPAATSPLHADPGTAPDDPLDASSSHATSPTSTSTKRFVVNLLITSAGKDGLIYTWNLATGRSTRTLRHHASAVTGVAAMLDEGGRTTILSASTDGSLAHLSFSSALSTAALEAYKEDCAGTAISSQLLLEVPDQFLRWPQVYLLIRQEKMTVDQFFAMENFALFSEAIKDGRCDFVETFLPLSPSGLVHLCQGASTALTRDRRGTMKGHPLLAHILTKRLDGMRKDLQEGISAFGHNLQEVFIQAGDKGRDASAFGGASILRQAIMKEDIRIILCILDNWRALLNAPPHDWMEQCKGAFTRLEKSDLIALADKFPLIFQNFITSLRLQRAHPLVVRDCNAKAEPNKEFLKKGTNGNLRQDVELWKTRGRKSKETMSGQYLPLAYAADLEMLRAYTDVCNKLDSVAIFQSEVGAVAVKFAWSRYGMRQHMWRFAQYIVFIFALIGFLLTDTTTNRVHGGVRATDFFSVTLLLFVLMQMLGHYRQCVYEKRTLLQHFWSFWPMLEFFGAVFIAYSTVTRLGQENAGSAVNLSKFLLSLNLLIQLVTALSFFRAFENTGPLVAMVIRIIYDIRFYLALLATVLFGFSLSFWCLCSRQYSLPDVITYHNMQSPAPAWYQSPIAGNDDPQGTYAFATIQGAYLESFIFLTGQFSVVPFVACGYTNHTQSINVAQRGFAIFLSALFAVLVQILMVNVLIALMTESYGRMSERGLAQAKLMQAQLMCESAGQLSAHMKREKARGNVLQPKILHILSRAGAAQSNQDADAAADKNVAAQTTEQVAQHTRARADKIDGLLRSKAVEVDAQISEQEEILFSMRRKLDVLLLKTKRVLNQ